MRILLTGGGTAGHVMPHIALLSELRPHCERIVYIGSQDGIERSIIEPRLPYYAITTTKLVRGKILKNLFIPFKLIKGVREAKKIIRLERPNVVFSKGGFVALPVVIAARKLKVPVVAHESDLKMGLANKLSRRSASVILTSFEDTAQREKKGVFTGSPMRDELFVDKAAARAGLKIDTTKPVLVVVGGSLGSRFLNEKIRSELKPLTKKFYVLHVVGSGNLDPRLEGTKDYRQFEFTKDIGKIYAAADVVVSRAGSNTIFELAALKKPMLLVPLPKGASRGDQVDNAKYFNKNGYANFISEQQLEGEDILPYIEQTYNERESLVKALNKGGFKRGNSQIIEIILNTAKKDD